MITFNISAINLEKVGKLIQTIFEADLSKEEAILMLGIINEANNYSRELSVVVSSMLTRQSEKKPDKDYDYSIA